MLFVAAFICQKGVLLINSEEVGTLIKTVGFYPCDGVYSRSFISLLAVYVSIFSHFSL